MTCSCPAQSGLDRDPAPISRDEGPSAGTEARRLYQRAQTGDYKPSASLPLRLQMSDHALSPSVSPGLSVVPVPPPGVCDPEVLPRLLQPEVQARLQRTEAIPAARRREGQHPTRQDAAVLRGDQEGRSCVRISCCAMPSPQTRSPYSTSLGVSDREYVRWMGFSRRRRSRRGRSWPRSSRS